MSDLVFTTDDGDASVWQNFGNLFTQGTVLNGEMGPEWSAFGVGDFNGGVGGNTGLVWTNGSGGQVAIWQLSEARLTGFSIPEGRMGSEWHVASLGDFNGDHNTDVLWENTTGNFNVWSLNDLALQSTVDFSAQIGSERHIIAHGDFFGSGEDGLLWEDTSGNVQSWALKAIEATTVITVGQMGSEWRCAGVGSFQNDGFDRCCLGEQQQRCPDLGHDRRSHLPHIHACGA
jgi:hypothetical protein